MISPLAAWPCPGRSSCHPAGKSQREITGAPSARTFLLRVCELLGQDRTAEIDALVGDEARWSDQAAIWEPGRSVGDTPEAHRLRVLADDLLTELYLHAPRRRDGWRAAYAQATSAVAVLRYHAAAAAPLGREERFARLVAVRDALMAENLLAARVRLRPAGHRAAAPCVRPAGLRQHRHARPADAARDRPAAGDRPRPRRRPYAAPAVRC
ncbi:TraB/GumN family protein [Micromonospora craniellae]|nr:erythromycin esterase family protein [Micromonospora craniellae]